MDDDNYERRNTTDATVSSELVGWTLESSGRGTLSLITTCLVTIALCTWVVIHPRINKRRKFRLTHKMALFLKTFIAPELIAVEAAQEWTQARQLVKDSEKVTNGGLHILHAFYIGMFGIRYHTTNGTRILWPNQFLWLLEQGLFDWRGKREWGLELQVIKDKSKADSAAKLFALLQSAWFLAQSIMRAAHRLPLAPLESMTLGYIPLFVITYFYWWLKPKDVETPSEVYLPIMDDDQKRTFEALAISDAFDEEATAEQSSLWQVWYLTPRTFEKVYKDEQLRQAEQDYEKASQAFVRHERVCEETACTTCKLPEPCSPKPEDELVLSHWDPTLYHSKLYPLACLVGISFGALHLASWDTRFPTFAELWLWRAAAIVSMATMLVFMQFERVVVRWQDPLMLVKIASPVLYLLSRLVMTAGAIAAFRATDPGVYETYVASSYWVHLL